MNASSDGPPSHPWDRWFAARDGLGELVWARPGWAPERSDQVETIRVAEAVAWVQRARHDRELAAFVTRLDAEVHGTFPGRGLDVAERLESAVRRLCDELRLETLVLQRVRRAWSGGGGGPEPVVAPPPPPTPVGPATTWVEVALLDEQSRAPLAGERVRVVAPSGEVHERRTDDRGALRLEGLDPGSCDIGFPDIDAGEWFRDGAAPAAGPSAAASGRRVRVEVGETALRVAARHAFRRVDSAWLRPENDALRALRRSPDVLAPGDLLFVPDTSHRIEPGDTSKRHVFLAPRPEERLRVRMRWSDARPMASRAYTLELDGSAITGQTSGGGEIDVAIPLGTREARLRFDDDPELEWELSVGDLDPVDEACPDLGQSGALGRLGNLAHYQAEGSDGLQFMAAACNFTTELSERAMGLPTDERTRLRTEHGC